MVRMGDWKSYSKVVPSHCYTLKKMVATEGLTDFRIQIYSLRVLAVPY